MTSAALEIVILIGIPASGKSTFYRERFSETHVLVSKDLMKSSRDRAGKQTRLIEEALASGSSVVVDNTNPTVEDRAAIIQNAVRHEARIVGYYFDTDVAEALRRNARRTGRARVPDIAIRIIEAKMTRPRYDEGFDELHVVRIVKKAFVVEAASKSPEDRIRS